MCFVSTVETSAVLGTNILVLLSWGQFDRLDVYFLRFLTFPYWKANSTTLIKIPSWTGLFNQDWLHTSKKAYYMFQTRVITWTRKKPLYNREVYHKETMIQMLKSWRRHILYHFILFYFTKYHRELDHTPIWFEYFLLNISKNIINIWFEYVSFVGHKKRKQISN